MAARRDMRAGEDRDSLRAVVQRLDLWGNTLANAAYGSWLHKRDMAVIPEGWSPYPDFFYLYNASNCRFISDLVVDACKDICVKDRDVKATVDKLSAFFIEKCDLKHSRRITQNAAKLIRQAQKRYRKEKDFPCAAVDHGYVYDTALILYQHALAAGRRSGFVGPQENTFLGNVEAEISRAVNKIDAGGRAGDYLLPVTNPHPVPYIENGFDILDAWLKAQKLIADKKAHDLRFESNVKNPLSDEFNALCDQEMSSLVFGDILNFLHMHKSTGRWQVFYEQAAYELIHDSDDLNGKDIPQVTANTGIQAFFKSWFESYFDYSRDNAPEGFKPENLKIIAAIGDAVNKAFPVRHAAPPTPKQALRH